MKTKIKQILAGIVALIIVGGLAVSLVMNFSLKSDLATVKADFSKLSAEKTDKNGGNTDKNGGFDEDDYDDDWYDSDRGDITYDEGDYYHENGELIKIADDYTIRDFDYIAQSYLQNDESLLKSDADRETLQLAKGVLDEIITDGMTDYEKELAIHDWLCTAITFDSSSLSAIVNSDVFADTPYGTLKYHNAVCVGYATTFRLLTTMAGLKCDVVHNSDYSHTWNIIKLDDGEYYIVDVYSDSSSDGIALHSCFNVNQETFLEFNDWDVERYPVANGTKYDYATMNTVEFDDFDKAIEEIVKLEETGGEIFFTVKNANYGDMYYVADGIANRLNMQENTYANFDVKENDDRVICTMTIEIWEDDFSGGDWIDMDDITIDTDEMDEKLDKFFGSYDFADYYTNYEYQNIELSGGN